MSQKTKDAVAVGDTAPDFTLPSQNGERIRLYDLLETRAVVLYFYPKDNTSGCTAEACAFRDSYEVFKDAGAEVVGVSSDSVESHGGFAAKHRLPFILLSDRDKTVTKLYGVPATLGILPGRITYVIKQDGTVVHIFNSMMQAKKHSEEALRILKELQVR